MPKNPLEQWAEIVEERGAIEAFLDCEHVQLALGNKKLPPISVPAKDLRIQGVVVGIMRKF